MSHFSKLKVRVKDRKLGSECARRLGWSTVHVDEYENPWRAAKERVKDVTLFRDARGQVKLALAANGDVIHDAWSMGKEAYGFLRDYSEAFIRKTAAAEGAFVSNKGVDAQGNIVLELEYA